MCTIFFQNLPHIKRSINQLLYFYNFFIIQTGSSFFSNYSINSQSILKKLVYIFKIHSRIICALRVVCKSQYFWNYSRKTDFLPLTYIFWRTVTHSKIIQFNYFFRRVQEILNKFFRSWIISFSKISEAKTSKNWISWRPSWIFGRHLELTMGTF